MEEVGAGMHGKNSVIVGVVIKAYRTPGFISGIGEFSKRSSLERGKNLGGSVSRSCLSNASLKAK